VHWLDFNKGIANFKFVRSFSLSATQDKCTTFMELLTPCYKDRTGAAHQSRCRREGTELFERHSSREYSSQVLERDVTKIERERDWSAVRLSICNSSLLSIKTPDSDWISGLRKEIKLEISSNYYWAYLEKFKIMDFMTDWFVKLNFVTLRWDPPPPLVCYK
jgi:hypothetical protein